MKYKLIFEPHLRKQARKIHQEKWSDFKMSEMNFQIKNNEITGVPEITMVSADGPKLLSQLLRIG